MLRTALLVLSIFLLNTNGVFAQFEWTMIESPTTETLNDITMVNENVIYTIGTNGIIMKSIDGGETFDIQNTREGFNLNAIFAIDEQNVWVVGENSLIYRTTDGGATWTWEMVDFPSTFTDVHFMDENKGFLVYDDLNDGDRLKVIFTEDGGVTWTPSNLPLDVELPTGTVEVTTYQHRTSIDFPSPEVGYLCFTQGLLKSTDGGLNWSVQAAESQPNYGLTGSFPVAMDFMDADHGIIVSPFQSAIAYTTDGAANIAMTDESHEFGGYGVKYLSPNDAYVVGDLDYAIYHLTDNGASVATQFFVGNPSTVIDSTRRFYAVDFWNTELGVAIGGNGKIARFAQVVSGVDHWNDLAISVYPNPVQDRLYINVPQDLTNEVLAIQLVNQLGQTVWKNTLSNTSTWNLDMTNFNTGIYYLNIQTADGQVGNRKIVVH